jgi:hypothetical protein
MAELDAHLLSALAEFIVQQNVIPLADYPFSPISDLPHQWVGKSAAGKSAAERRGRSSA